MIYHRCLNVECAIKYADILKGALDADGKVLKTRRQVKRFLKIQRKLGRLVLPMCECDNFDYLKGCLGHDD